MTSLLLLLPSLSHAGAWEAKTMRDPLSAREVERPLILGKGWLEFGLGVDVKNSYSEWGPDGEVIWYDGAADKEGTSTRFQYTTESLQVRYGVARRAELYWKLPVHRISLTNPALGTDTRGWYIGDPRFGWKFELFRTESPLTSVITKMELKVPAGNESTGSYIGGPSTFSSFVTTTGTTDLDLGLAGRRQFGIFGVQGELGYVYRFSGIAMYLVETERNQFAARMKPGAQVYAKAGGIAQLGPAAVHGTFWFENHGPARVGISSDGIFPDNDLEVVPGSDGYSYGVDAGATLAASRNIDFVFNANVPIRGEDLMFFPIEDLHPTRGVTWSGTLELRF